MFVAVGPAPLDALALSAAARLAQAAGTELAALFIEDVNLLRLAELPFAVEIGTTSAAPRRLVASDIERAYRNQANALRRELAELANALQLTLTFEVARGRPVRVLLEASGTMDLVVLASSARQTFTLATSADLVRSALRATSSGVSPHPARPVAAALQAGPAALRVLAAAHRLAQANAADLLLLVAEPDALRGVLSATVDDWLAQRNAIARVTLLPDFAPLSIARHIAEERAYALFWPGDGEPAVTAGIDALLASIDCPLIVVR